MAAMTVREYHETACPKCGKDDQLIVAAQVWVKLVPDGTEDHGGDTEFDDHHVMRCDSCMFSGTVADFYIRSAMRRDEPRVSPRSLPL